MLAGILRSVDSAQCRSWRVWLFSGTCYSHLTLQTAQVLLAVAAGAWLMTPEWVAASLQAGHWLPEAPYQAQARKCRLYPKAPPRVLPRAVLRAMHALRIREFLQTSSALRGTCCQLSSVQPESRPYTHLYTQSCCRIPFPCPCRDL